MFISLLASVGIAFLILAGLLAHEVIVGGDKTPAASLRGVLQRAVAKTVLDFDRDTIFGATVPVVLFIVLPGAALLNAVLGGSPLMLVCYLLIAVSIFVHMLLVGRAGAVMAAVAGAGAALALVFMPYYAVWSLTSHMLSGSPAEGALAGMLIASVLYAANAGVWTLMHARPDSTGDGLVHRFAGAVLAAMPIGYLLYWFVVLGLTIGGANLASVRGWDTLIVFSLAVALCFAVFKAVLDAGARQWHGKFTSAWGSGGIGALAILAAHAIH